MYIILKTKCVTQITFTRYLDIIKYIFLHKCYIRRYFQKQKTPLNEWSLLSLILQIDLYTIYSYTSIEYMITSLLVSLLKQTPLQF